MDQDQLTTAVPADAGIDLYERDSQLGLVDAAVRSARAGRGSVVFFEGHFGSGKSRLIAAAGELATRDGVTLLTARGNEREAELDFGVAWQLLDGVTRPSLELSSIEALHAALADASDEGATMLLIDDAELVDAATMRLLLHTAERLDRLGLAIVLSARPLYGKGGRGLLAKLADSPHARRADCPPLSPGAASRWVNAAFRVEADPEFRQACYDHTRGNPALLEALLADLLRRSVDPAAASCPLVHSAAPRPIADKLEVGLGQAGPEVLGLARAAAIAREEAQLRHCAELAELDESAAARAADVLIAEGLVELSADGLEFVHPMVRAALYDGHPPATRALAHLRLGSLLSGERAGPERVARHLMPGLRLGKPWVGDTLAAAASAALARGDPHAAIAYLSRALEEPVPAEAQPEITLALGRAEALAGDPRAVEHLNEAARSVETPQTRALVSLEVGRALYARGRVSDAVDAFRRGAREAAGGDPELELKLRTSHSVLARVAGMKSPDAPEPPRVDAVRDDTDETAAGRMSLAHLALERALTDGRRADVVRLAHRALGGQALLLEETSDGVCFHFAAMALVIAEDLQGAEVAFAMARDEATRRGSRMGEATARFFRSWALARRGMLSEAAAEARAALAGEDAGWRVGGSNVRALLGYALVALGDPDEARAAFEGAARRATGGFEVPLPLFHSMRARFHLEAGDPESALADFRECERRLRGLTSNPACASWRSGIALAHSQMGHAGEALDLVEQEVALAQAFGAPGPIGRALEVRAMLLSREERREALEQAAERLRESEWLLDRARVLIKLGIELRHERKRGDAREPLREGLALAVRCGAAPLALQARSELLASGVRPRRTALRGVDSLTEREYQVARLVAEGLSNKAAAEAMFVTVKTIEWHLRNAFSKLEVHSRQELAAELAAHGPRAAEE